MRRFTNRILARSALLALVLAVPALAQETKPMPAAPKGFDTKRDNIQRGKIESVEYDSQSIGTKRKMVIYTPPGYATTGQISCVLLAARGRR
jgi:enterochelin esterase-like enzyme